MAEAEGLVALDPRFVRSFARQAALAVLRVETPSDRKRRDELWKTEKLRLWEPLFLLIRIISFPLHVVTAVQQGIVFGFSLYGVLVGFYLCLLLSPGLIISLHCHEYSYADRHSCAASGSYFFGNTFIAVLNEAAALAADHAHRIWEWVFTGRTDIGGCWAHPEPAVEFVPPLMAAINIVMGYGPMAPLPANAGTKGKTWQGRVTVPMSSPTPGCRASLCKPLGARFTAVVPQGGENHTCLCLWEVWV